MPGFGIGETIAVFIMFLVYLIPLAAMVWIIVTLHRIRADNAAIKSRLEAIEQQLQRGAQS